MQQQRTPTSPQQLVTQMRDWRNTFEQPFPVDAWDPLARFVREQLHWEWPQVWLATFLLYGPIEKILLPVLGGYLVLDGPMSGWRPDMEALLTGFVEFPFFFAFYTWTGQGISNLWVSLARHKSFRNDQEYARFLEEAQRDYDRWLWPLLSLLVALLVMGVMDRVVWSAGATVPPWHEAGGMPARLLSLALIGLVAYAIAQTLLREIVTLLWLRRLWNRLGNALQVHPYHPDGAGGVGAIGQHAVSFAAFSLMITLFLVMATLLPTIRDPATAPTVWNPVIALIWTLYLLVLPSLFFILIYPAHQAMQAAATQRLTRLSSLLDEQLAALEESAVSAVERLPDLLENVKNLRAVHGMLADDLPRWPINASIRHQLRLSALFPLLYSLFTLALEWFTRR